MIARLKALVSNFSEFLCVLISDMITKIFFFDLGAKVAYNSSKWPIFSVLKRH